MDFLKRIMSRSRNEAEVNLSLDEATYTEFPESRVRVPDDHHVTYFRPTYEPELLHSHGGTLIASLGTVSDEFQEELRRVTANIDAVFSSNENNAAITPLPILLAAEARRLSDLFAPNDPVITPLYGLLLWIIDARSAPLWLSEPEPLLAAVRRGREYQVNEGPITQYALLVIESYQSIRSTRTTRSRVMSNIDSQRETIELARLLTDVGVSVGAVPDDGNFFIEVCRPKGTIGLLRMEPILKDSVIREEASNAKGTQVSCFVVRAPRLRRLTLAAMEKPSERTRYQLLNELLSREIALLVMTDREGRLNTRSWPEIGEALPVYPDLSSLYQAAEDMGIHKDTLAWWSAYPSELFAWADQKSFGFLALNVYEDRTSPKYFILKKQEIYELARRRLPIPRAPNS